MTDTTARDVIAFEVGSFERADAILSALLAAPESARLDLARRLNPWRQIETAPKDGAWIYGYEDREGVSSKYVGNVVMRSRKRGADYAPAWYTDGGNGFTECFPTHWLPLSAPPASEE